MNPEGDPFEADKEPPANMNEDIPGKFTLGPDKEDIEISGDTYDNQLESPSIKIQKTDILFQEDVLLSNNLFGNIKRKWLSKQ